MAAAARVPFRCGDRPWLAALATAALVGGCAPTPEPVATAASAVPQQTDVASARSPRPSYGLTDGERYSPPIPRGATNAASRSDWRLSGPPDTGDAPPADRRLGQQGKALVSAFDEPGDAHLTAPRGPALGLQAVREVQHGVASWYGPGFHGRRTANGETFDMHALTAAHKTLPFGTRVLVHNPRTGKEVVVRINDRGPFVKGRIIDLSSAAAQALGLKARGHDAVELRILGQPAAKPAPKNATSRKAAAPRTSARATARPAAKPAARAPKKPARKPAAAPARKP